MIVGRAGNGLRRVGPLAWGRDFALGLLDLAQPPDEDRQLVVNPLENLPQLALSGVKVGWVAGTSPFCRRSASVYVGRGQHRPHCCLFFSDRVVAAGPIRVDGRRVLR